MDIIPIDIPLELPAPLWFLKFALIAFFLVHIVLINFMIGGAVWTVFLRMLGKEDPFWARLAKDAGETVTVTKSLAVVIGVAPLLALSLVYTGFFYPANNITAPFWLSIIILVPIAFVSLYIYKYTWDSERYGERFKYFWGFLAVAIFFFVPLIFLANINLMLYPDQWKNISNFWGALWVPNVLPRYLHFMNASFAVFGFFVFGYFTYKEKKESGEEAYSSRAKKVGLKWGLFATLLQMFFGVLNYLTLPQSADSVTVLVLITVAVIFAGIMVYLVFLLLYTDKNVNANYIYLALFLVLSLMATMRHTVRENALREPKKIAAHRTEIYRAKQAAFMATYSPEGETRVTGETVFNSACAVCHAIDIKLVGPPMVAVIGKYRGDKETLTAFIENPTKVDDTYPVMPKPAISSREIDLVADYLLNLEVGENEK